MENKFNYKRDWTDPSIKIGRLTIGIAVLVSFLPNIYLYLAHGAVPGFSTAITAWLNIAAVYGAFYFVEPFSYYPIFGLTGTYMGILSGNMANVRVPASATAQEVIGVESGTEEAELVSVLGIAGSIVTNLFFLVASVLLGAKALEIMPPLMRIAFESYTLPSLFGALYGQFTIQEPKIALYALPLAIVMRLLQAPAWLIIIVSVFGTVALTRILYSKKVIK